MKIIAHRGNLEGPNKDKENHPSYIQQAIEAGFDVEVDVWFEDNSYYLGHDNPLYKISQNFLQNEKIWCHAKNINAMQKMRDDAIHYFWHENDKFTLTSKGIPWCYPGNFIKNGIAVMPESVLSDQNLLNLRNQVLGVCTDYPSKFTSAAYNRSCELNI